MECELNRSHWSKPARSFLCSDITSYQKKQRPCDVLFILLFPNISPLVVRPYERGHAKINVKVLKASKYVLPLTATGSMSFKSVEDRVLYSSLDTFHQDILTSCQYGLS